jgi:hypothetical protein
MPPTRTNNSSSVNWVAEEDASDIQPKNQCDTATYNDKLVVLDYLCDPKHGNYNQSHTAKYFSSPTFKQANPSFPKARGKHDCYPDMHAARD